MRFIIEQNNEDQRLDVFLSEVIKNASRSKIQMEIKKGKAFVNSNQVKASYMLKEDDIVDFDFAFIENSLKPISENIPLDIIWEDENMAVINKPSNMLTHPTLQEMNGTLVNALLYHYGENLSNINGDLRRGIVHRLDRNTSGLLMIAKNNTTHEFLSNEMKLKNFTKKYIAIVKGVIEKDDFLIDLPLGRHLTQPYKQAVRKDGKESQTYVKVLERFSDATFIELTLITGRTHQIRVHLSAIGHPVYNDTLYGFGKMKIKTDEQVLQSYKLEFTKPLTDERISLEIPPDSKFEKVLNALRN
ncbi:RluA family pseudouridine synthase [bacterium]|nr:RluA family pseudouridine synthase [bacterium]